MSRRLFLSGEEEEKEEEEGASVCAPFCRSPLVWLRVANALPNVNLLSGVDHGRSLSAYGLDDKGAVYLFILLYLFIYLFYFLRRTTPSVHRGQDVQCRDP